jgi:hypothetical protein
MGFAPRRSVANFQAIQARGIRHATKIAGFANR